MAGGKDPQSENFFNRVLRYFGWGAQPQPQALARSDSDIGFVNPMRRPGAVVRSVVGAAVRGDPGVAQRLSQQGFGPNPMAARPRLAPVSNFTDYSYPAERNPLYSAAVAARVSAEPLDSGAGVSAPSAESGAAASAHMPVSFNLPTPLAALEAIALSDVSDEEEVASGVGGSLPPAHQAVASSDVESSGASSSDNIQNLDIKDVYLIIPDVLRAKIVKDFSEAEKTGFIQHVLDDLFRHDQEGVLEVGRGDGLKSVTDRAKTVLFSQIFTIAKEKKLTELLLAIPSQLNPQSTRFQGLVTGATRDAEAFANTLAKNLSNNVIDGVTRQIGIKRRESRETRQRQGFSGDAVLDAVNVGGTRSRFVRGQLARPPASVMALICTGSLGAADLHIQITQRTRECFTSLIDRFAGAKAQYNVAVVTQEHILAYLPILEEVSFAAMSLWQEVRLLKHLDTQNLADSLIEQLQALSCQLFSLVESGRSLLFLHPENHPPALKPFLDSCGSVDKNRLLLLGYDVHIGRMAMDRGPEFIADNIGMVGGDAIKSVLSSDYIALRSMGIATARAMTQAAAYPNFVPPASGPDPELDSESDSASRAPSPPIPPAAIPSAPPRPMLTRQNPLRSPRADLPTSVPTPPLPLPDIHINPVPQDVDPSLMVLGLGCGVRNSVTAQIAVDCKALTQWFGLDRGYASVMPKSMPNRSHIATKLWALNANSIRQNFAFLERYMRRIAQNVAHLSTTSPGNLSGKKKEIDAALAAVDKALTVSFGNLGKDRAFVEQCRRHIVFQVKLTRDLMASVSPTVVANPLSSSIVQSERGIELSPLPSSAPADDVTKLADARKQAARLLYFQGPCTNKIFKKVSAVFGNDSLEGADVRGQVSDTLAEGVIEGSTAIPITSGDAAVPPSQAQGSVDTEILTMLNQRPSAVTPQALHDELYRLKIGYVVNMQPSQGVRPVAAILDPKTEDVAELTTEREKAIYWARVKDGLKPVKAIVILASVLAAYFLTRQGGGGGVVPSSPIDHCTNSSGLFNISNCTISPVLPFNSSTVTATDVPVISYSQTLTQTASQSVSGSQSASQTASLTQTASQSSTETQSSSQTVSSTQTASQSVTQTATASQTASLSGTASGTTSQTSTASQSLSQVSTPSQSASQASSVSRTPSNTASQVNTPSQSSSQVQTSSQTSSHTPTATQTPSPTQAGSQSISASLTVTPTQTRSASQGATTTPTPSQTQTSSQSVTGTQVVTSTPTKSPSQGVTTTQTPSQTQTSSQSVTSTQVMTPTQVGSSSRSMSQAASSTQTQTLSQTASQTPSASCTVAVVNLGDLSASFHVFGLVANSIARAFWLVVAPGTTISVTIGGSSQPPCFATTCFYTALGNQTIVASGASTGHGLACNVTDSFASSCPSAVALTLDGGP